MSGLLDSRQLQAFAAVARRQSFTLAAKDLHLTQSAVSHALRALEDDLGFRLLDRRGRSVTLTAAGEQFLRHTGTILTEMEMARAGLDALSRWGHGRLRIGAGVTACRYILPAALREFRQSFPRCTVTIEPGDSGRQLDCLRTGAVDLAVMPEPERDRNLAAAPLFEDELRLLVAPGHAWIKSGRPPRGAFPLETLLVHNRRNRTFHVLSEHLREEGHAPGTVLELGSFEAIKEMAKIGLGVGVMAPWMARAEIEAGALVDLPLGRRRLTRRWCVASLRDRRLPLGEETFIGLCQGVARGLAWSGRSEASLPAESAGSDA